MRVKQVRDSCTAPHSARAVLDLMSHLVAQHQGSHHECASPSRTAWEGKPLRRGHKLTAHMHTPLVGTQPRNPATPQRTLLANVMPPVVRAGRPGFRAPPRAALSCAQSPGQHFWD